MVIPIENQLVTGNHLNSIDGHEMVPTISVPFQEKEMVTPNSLKNKTNDHLTISTITSCTSGEKNQDDIGLLISSLSEEERYIFEERAGIMEHDGKLSREEAERRALKEVLGNKRLQPTSPSLMAPSSRDIFQSDGKPD